MQKQKDDLDKLSDANQAEREKQEKKVKVLLERRRRKEEKQRRKEEAIARKALLSGQPQQIPTTPSGQPQAPTRYDTMTDDPFKYDPSTVFFIFKKIIIKFLQEKP